METKYENKLERLKDVMILINSQLHSNQSFTDKLFKLLYCTDFEILIQQEVMVIQSMKKMLQKLILYIERQLK